MDAQTSKPVGKPRGRNGGRKPLPAGERAVVCQVRLPQRLMARVDSVGPNRSAAVRRLLLAGLEKISPE